MAIIYSYPRVNTLNGTDLLIGTRFENEDNGNARSISFTVEALGDYVATTYAPTLDQVLTAGNESLLDANINYLYLYDDAETEYGHIRISDSGFDVFDANDLIVSRIDRGGITIAGPTYGSGILTGSITANRSYTLPNKSGTFAMLSDITASANYGLASQIADSIPITNTTTESSLIGDIVGTLSVPANGFAVGDSFKASLMGIISCLNSATLHIRIKTAAGALLVDTGVIDLSAATDKRWDLEVNFTIRSIGTAGVAAVVCGGAFSYNRDGSNNPESINFTDKNNTNFNTTVLNQLVITAEWNNASFSNAIYSQLFTLNKIY